MVKLAAVAKIIQRPDSNNIPGSNAQGSYSPVNNVQIKATSVKLPVSSETDPFSGEEIFGVKKGQYFKKIRNRVLADIDELISENRWQDIISLYHPAEEKIPDLIHAGMDIRIRGKLAFALGHVQQFDEAIKVLLICVKAEPNNFYTRSSLAYTAYNSLYAAKNKEIFLAGNCRAERIALAHENFKKAQSLRPDGITNFYRQAMLYSQLENKPKPALALFNTACTNWENLKEEELKKRHQEKKNYIKSLYRSASLLLEAGNGITALERITKCLAQDEHTNYLSLEFKYFALGKVNFCLDEYENARNALLFAVQSSSKGHRAADFIYELLARTYLALGKTDKALGTIEKVPEKQRRPYYRWTEADVLCSAGRFEQAKKVLNNAISRDNRSKHISLIRLTKIEYSLKEYESATHHAESAGAFFRTKWGNAYFDGLFWQALCTFKSGRTQKAESLLTELETQCRFFPKLDKLSAMIRGTSD